MSNADAIPDFLRLSQVPVNYLQKVETSVLDPVVFNEGSGSTVDGFIRFTLQRKGFLHSHSKLFLSLTPASAVSRAIFPANVGIGSIIKTAVLKIGNKVLNEISDWDYLHSFKSANITNENNVERELYTTGRYMNHAFDYDDGDETLAPDYTLDTGRDIDDDDRKMLPFAIMDGGSPAESPSYAIDLSDLFPFLKVHSLPLYMIDEPINIELTVRPPVNHRIAKITGTAEQSFVIDRNELRFVADYIYYGAGDEMEAFAQKNRQMSFSFVDYRLSTTSASVGQLQSGMVRNIGMANRMVTNILTVFNTDRSGEESLLANLGSVSTAIEGAGANVGKLGTISYNVRYNDLFEFSSNISNLARLFNLTQDSQGVLFVTRDEFCGQGGGLSPTTTFEGLSQVTNLQGQFFLLATKLTGGRVGSRGVEIHLTANDMQTMTTMRSFSEYMRVAQLSDGGFTVYNV